MRRKIGVAILAAGEGKRLKTNIPKALLPLLGRKMIDFPIQESHQFIQDAGLEAHWGIVIGHMKEQVQDYLSHRYIQGKDRVLPIHFATQARPLGTADALMAYFSQVEGAKNTDWTLVMCADVPLIKSEDLMKMFTELAGNVSGGGGHAVAASFEAADPTGYGRIVRSGKEKASGFKIVEQKHTDGITSLINEVNASLYLIKTSFILERLHKIPLNPVTGEYYLTDLFQGEAGSLAINFGRGDRFLGVNTLKQLEEVSDCLRRERADALLLSGVRVMDSKGLYLDWDVQVGPHSVIYPNVHLEGKVEIGSGVIIEAGAFIKDSKIGDGAIVKAYSYLENARVREGASVGPFAHLRPGADIGEGAKVGNFVEIKKARLDKGVKVSHLSYVGDAEIGQDSNIGCGFITCNYDGVSKHLTKIGKNSFIGSDCQAVAPVEIGSDAFVAAGSTITTNVPDGAFAIARGRQVNKEGMAKKFLKKKNSF